MKVLIEWFCRSMVAVLPFLVVSILSLVQGSGAPFSESGLFGGGELFFVSSIVAGDALVAFFGTDRSYYLWKVIPATLCLILTLLFMGMYVAILQGNMAGLPSEPDRIADTSVVCFVLSGLTGAFASFAAGITENPS